MENQKKGFWLESSNISGNLHRGPQRYSTKSMYGIRSHIETKLDGNVPRTYLCIDFSIKKQNSAKFANQLKNDLPELMPARVKLHCSRSRLLQVDYMWSHKRPKEDREGAHIYNATYNGENISRDVKTSAGDIKEYYYLRKSYKQHKSRHKKGKYPYAEFLNFSIEYPLLFGTNFEKIFYKVYEYRLYATKLLAKYKAEDDLKKLRGEPTTPEHDQQGIDNLIFDPPKVNDPNSTLKSSKIGLYEEPLDFESPRSRWHEKPEVTVDKSYGHTMGLQWM